MAYDARTTVDQMAVGEIDLMLAARPSLPVTLRTRRLYEEHFLCVMRRGHPAAAAPLTLDRFCELDHVLVSPVGGGFRGTVDEALDTLGRRRRVAVSINSFMLVPSLLTGSELVATVPARLARGWSRIFAVLSPPCEVAGFSVMMGWHERVQSDPAVAWLRDRLWELVGSESA